MDWQLVASYFIVKSTDIFYSVIKIVKSSFTINNILQNTNVPILQKKIAILI